ncbi:MAG: winged helix DNA-binding domain-containing protein [Candidatus Thorarchaeota archaeon]
MNQFNMNQILNLTLNKHHLSSDSKIDDILKICDDLCGLHATGTIEPYLSLFARTNRFKKEDLDKQLYNEKNLGRIRGMRKTLFIETKEMIPIVHNSIKFSTDQRDQQYLEIREISIDEYNTLAKQILELLNKKEMSTTEIKKTLSSQKDIIAVISVMCDQMLLIRGKPMKSWKDRRILYAPFEAYFPNINLNKHSQEEAIRLLIHKYIRSYGPVTLKDIAWWLGISNSQVNAALIKLEDRIENIRIDNLDLDYIILREDLNKIPTGNPLKEKTVNLLPRLDPYLMGYKDRDRYINPDDFEFIYDRSGNATSTILLNGRVIGIWDVVEKAHPFLKLYVFKKMEESVMIEIVSQGKKLGKFITGKDVDVKLCEEMIPLTKRTMGGFMSPLKECN